MPLGLGIWEVVILLAVVALLFGVKGVPDVARRLGLGVREVRDAVADVDPRRMLDAPEKPAPRPQPALAPPERSDGDASPPS
jgi:TatA/E family protein of Tat protein translocase